MPAASIRHDVNGTTIDGAELYHLRSATRVDLRRCPVHRQIRYQKRLPGTPLNGPATCEVIQPP